ncbi:MAG: hypothetical protein IJT34_02735 [Butyrivibrio sp.]|nr:hypothetical protein [Butyrivibrio sp.]
MFIKKMLTSCSKWIAAGSIVLSAALLPVGCGAGNTQEQGPLAEIRAARDAAELDRGYAGILPFCKEDGGWGAVEAATGKELVPFVHGGLGGISRTGLMIFYDGAHHYVYNAQGELRYEGDEDVSVEGASYGVLELQPDGSRRVVRYDAAGTLLPEEETLISAEAWDTSATEASAIQRYTLTETGQLVTMPAGELEINSYVQVCYGDGGYLAVVDGREVWHYLNGVALVETPAEDAQELQPLAVHDEIIMSEYRLWPVRDGQQWQYVDHLTGVTVAGEDGYDRASSFVGDYAVVIRDGQALVLDDTLQVVQKLGEAQDVETYGDYFLLRRADGTVRVYGLQSN